MLKKATGVIIMLAAVFLVAALASGNVTITIGKQKPKTFEEWIWQRTQENAAANNTTFPR